MQVFRVLHLRMHIEMQCQIFVFKQTLIFYYIIIQTVTRRPKYYLVIKKVLPTAG